MEKRFDKRCTIGRETRIGYDGEHNARRMLFNIRQYLERWPGAEPRMMVQRPGDFAPAYVETEMIDEDTIAWTITRYDTDRRGVGRMWIEFVDEVNDVVGLTEETPIIIRHGPNQVDPDTPVPLLPPWMQKIVELIGEIPGRVNAAIQAALDSGILKGAQGEPGPQGNPGPQGKEGQQGEEGFSPTITLRRTGKAVEMTVQNKDGEDSQTINDGYSPTIEIKRGATETTLTVTDAEGTKSVKLPSTTGNWNTNDPDGTGYIANRTHYREEMHEILPEIVGTETGVNNRRDITSRLSEQLIPGRMYTVSYNGAEYECEMKVADNYSGSFSPPPPYYYLGNYGGIGATNIAATDEPFCVVIDQHTYDPSLKDYFTAASCYIFDGAEGATVAIYEDVTKRLDADYLGKNGQVGRMLMYADDGVGEWKEVPCGEVVEETEFLRETTITPGGAATPLGRLLDGELITGATYTLYIDGTPYKTLCIEDYSGSQYLGMYKITGDVDQTDISIGVAAMSMGVPDNQRVVIFTEATDRFTLRIVGPAQVTKKLDNAYLDLNIKNGNADGSLRQIGTPVGNDSYQIGKNAAAFGTSLAQGEASFSSGEVTQARGRGSHSEGVLSQAIGEYSHSEGFQTQSNGKHSHAEGSGTKSNGSASHSEGAGTTAAGEYSHAEGVASTTAIGARAAHAEGVSTGAVGEGAHSEGGLSTAVGKYSHAEGNNTMALTDSSHAEGEFTYAAGCPNQHVQGRYNIRDNAGRYAHVVGNGTSDANRSNAHTVDWNGNAWYAGNVYVGGSSEDDGDKLVTKKEMDAALEESGSGLPEPAGPHMQLVTDADSNWTQVERLAYSTTETVEVLPEVTLTEITDEGAPIMEPLPGTVEIGKTYTVTYNGTDYVCVAFGVPMDDTGTLMAPALGNASFIGGDDTGEPFLTMIVPLEMASEVGAFGTVVPLDGAESVTVKITGDGTTYKKVPLEYLPEGVGGKETVHIVPETELEPDEGLGDGTMLITEKPKAQIVSGDIYSVMWNGTKYECVAFEMGGQVGLGNMGLISGGGSTGEPFVIAFIPDEMAADYGAYVMVIPLDGSVTATLSISGETIKRIDPEYLNLEWVPEMHDVGDVILPATYRDAGTNNLIIEKEAAEKMPIGTDIVVYVDDVRYECKVNPFTIGETTIGVAGNISFNDENYPDTGEPFMLMVPPDASGEGTMQMKNLGYWKCAIFAAGKTQGLPAIIPKKHLPDMTVFYVDLTKDGDLYKSNRTLHEIEYAFMKGRLVRCRKISYLNEGTCSISCDIAELSSISTDMANIVFSGEKFTATFKYDETITVIDK